jgi:phosphatidylethanolamine/phosphatidyl-N-methylethanolamine N-methyltransferase
MPSTTRAFLEAYFSPQGARTLGTPTVSQRSLRRAVVAALRQVTGPGPILETGAGDGPLTEGVVQAFPDRSVVAVEVVPLLAERLRDRQLPGVMVWELSAADVLAAWRAEWGSVAPGVILSGLPFRSLPTAVTERTLQAYRELLPVGSCVVQYTYFPEYLVRHPWPGFRVRAWRRVWKHLPPAGVVVLERV